MEVKLAPGKYVVAVSGGVDSMVLLHLAYQQKNLELIVAHFDHGIHGRSASYCDFVSIIAKEKGLRFVSEKGKLGVNTSEATARDARYKFLDKVKNQYDADAVLTAHHQGDVIETIIINLLRGTGRKGLASLKSTGEIIRPMINYSKEEIIKYAKNHKLEWREDPTNLETKYLRNYIRLKLIPRLSRQQTDQLLTLSSKQYKDSKIIESIIAILSQQRTISDGTMDESDVIVPKSQLDRKLFISLPHNVAKEVMAELLRTAKLPFDSKVLEKSTVFAKTAAPKKRMSITKSAYLSIAGDCIKLNLL